MKKFNSEFFLEGESYEFNFPHFSFVAIDSHTGLIRTSKGNAHNVYWTINSDGFFFIKHNDKSLYFLIENEDIEADIFTFRQFSKNSENKYVKKKAYTVTKDFFDNGIDEDLLNTKESIFKDISVNQWLSLIGVYFVYLFFFFILNTTMSFINISSLFLFIFSSLLFLILTPFNIRIIKSFKI